MAGVIFSYRSVVVTMVSVFLGLADSAVHHWDYSDTLKWNETSLVCLSGSRQSPINIATASSVSDWQLVADTLVFDRYSNGIPGDFVNNGHTVQFTINKTLVPVDQRPRIYGGGLGPQGYIFEQFHFHWGNSSSPLMGSEHTINGRSSPAEIHFVHYNSKYPNLTEAVNHQDGLAVVGFLFETVTDANLVKTDYNQITNLIPYILPVSSDVMTQLNFSKLLPFPAINSTGIYYRYDGSLTTPPCSEVVTWTVFEERIPILSSLLDSFRQALSQAMVLNETTGHENEIEIDMVNNFRPVQPLNGRVVKTNRFLVTAAPTTAVPPPTVVHWDYSDFTKWQAINQVCGNGTRQSPIAIATNTIVSDTQLVNDPLLFDRYSGKLGGEFWNNGHTVQFTISKAIDVDKRPRIYGGGLSVKGYIFEQFHFHWGNSSQGQASCMGAEHTIDGRSAPAEIHFVHYNSKYKNVAEAASKTDGLAVIGFLFEAVNDSSLVKTDYAQVTNMIARISGVNNKTSAQFDFNKLVPSSIVNGSGIYYRYDGSLTTPPCSEVVTWTVYETRIPIMLSALDGFRQALTTVASHGDSSSHHNETSHHGDAEEEEQESPIANNFRPIQNLNGRTVRTNRVITTTSGSSGSSVTAVTTAPSSGGSGSGSGGAKQNSASRCSSTWFSSALLAAILGFALVF